MQQSDASPPSEPHVSLTFPDSCRLYSKEQNGELQQVSYRPQSRGRRECVRSISVRCAARQNCSLHVGGGCRSTS